MYKVIICRGPWALILWWKRTRVLTNAKFCRIVIVTTLKNLPKRKFQFYFEYPYPESGLQEVSCV